MGILIGVAGIFIGWLWKRSADRQARRDQERLEAELNQARQERVTLESQIGEVRQLVGALVEQRRLEPRDAEPILRMLTVGVLDSVGISDSAHVEIIRAPEQEPPNPV
jgi:hypothetical protein